MSNISPMFEAIFETTWRCLSKAFYKPFYSTHDHTLKKVLYIYKLIIYIYINNRFFSLIGCAPPCMYTASDFRWTTRLIYEIRIQKCQLVSRMQQRWSTSFYHHDGLHFSVSYYKIFLITFSMMLFYWYVEITKITNIFSCLWSKL
jgi:hypothetical protein